MSSTDPLVEELLARPVGPKVIARRAPDHADLTRELELTGNNLTATIVGDTGTVDDSTAGDYLRAEGLNPDEWHATGFRKSVWGVDGAMESVRFTYARRQDAEAASYSLPAEVVDSWRSELLSGSYEPVSAAVEDDGTYAMLIADPQLGKKGTAEAIRNYKRGVRGHIKAIGSIADQVTGIHVGWMGDETENVVNSYGNQPHTVELNRSAQLELDYDLRVWALKEVLALNLPVSASSVISNHGEWTRNGGKEPVTTQGDNASTYVARQVKALFDELEPYTGRHIEWHIGGGDPGVSITLSGVPCYFSHGYIEKGKGGSTELRTKAAIERQILGKTDELGATLLWFMAHYHHLYFQEFEGRTLFGCPALEAEKSSEYMLNQYGVWSPPGMLGLLVTSSVARGWNHLNVF